MFVRHHGSQHVGEAERLSSNARGVNKLGVSDQETQAATLTIVVQGTTHSFGASHPWTMP